MCLLAILCIGGIIIGSVLGTRSTINATKVTDIIDAPGTILNLLFNLKAHDTLLRQS